MDKGYSICFNQWALDKSIKNELNLLLIISSLCAEKGYCFASNEYLAQLFKETEQTISRKIKYLEQKKYIEIEYDKRGCEVRLRRIRLTKMLIDDYQKCYSTINKNVKENNISINNTSNNKKNNKNNDTSTLTSLLSINDYQHISNDANDKVYAKLQEWLQYKQERKEYYKETGLKNLLSQIDKKIDEYGEEDVIELISECMANNWKGIIFDKLTNSKPKSTLKQLEDGSFDI